MVSVVGYLLADKHRFCSRTSLLGNGSADGRAMCLLGLEAGSAIWACNGWKNGCGVCPGDSRKGHSGLSVRYNALHHDRAIFWGRLVSRYFRWNCNFIVPSITVAVMVHDDCFDLTLEISITR